MFFNCIFIVNYKEIYNHSDIYIILQCVWKIIKPIKRTLITVIKSPENIYEYSLHGTLDVVKVNQISTCNITSYRAYQFWTIFEHQYLCNVSSKWADVLNLHN